MKRKDLAKTHPDYAPISWRMHRALVDGGPAVFQPEVLGFLLPRHGAETEESYKERCQRAFYVNYCAKIVGRMAAGVLSDPPRLEMDHDEEGDPPALPGWWAEWEENTAPRGVGAERKALTELAWDLVIDALTCGRAWTLCDLPLPRLGPGASLDDKEKSGDMDAYACPVAPLEVINWQLAPLGSPKDFVVTCKVEALQDAPELPRDTLVETYTVYTPTEQRVYEYRRKIHANGTPEKANPEAELMPVGPPRPHSFGRVQVRPWRLKPHLYAMGHLGSMARALLNKLCALDWAELKILFAQLYEFQAASRRRTTDAPASEVAKDPMRAVNQERGAGLAQVRDAGDRAEFVSPDAAGFQFAQQSIQDLIKWMHDVVEQMALSEASQGAALRRSAESKQADHASQRVVQAALGRSLRDHLQDVVETILAGRGEQGVSLCVRGMEEFDEIDPSELANEATILSGIPIPSPTYAVHRDMEFVRNRYSGQPAEFYAKVEAELRAAHGHQAEAEEATRQQVIDGPPEGEGPPAA